MSVGFQDHMLWALALFVLAMFTDTLDGEIARRRHLVTELGKFLDPLADKMLISTVLVIFVWQSMVPLWVVLIIIAREFLITGLRSVAASQGVVIAATSWGKSKTLTQTIMIIIIFLVPTFSWLGHIVPYIVGIATIATILSGLDYLWRYRRFVL